MQQTLMSTLISTAGGLAAGLVIGATFFALLRSSVSRLPGSPHPAVLMIASLLGRMGLVAASFYVLNLIGGPLALLGALAGFVIARVRAVRCAR